MIIRYGLARLNSTGLSYVSFLRAHGEGHGHVKKRSAALSSDTKGIETYIEKDTAPDYYSSPNKTYWPGALLGIIAGASYPAYFFSKLILEAHPTLSAWNVLINQGFIYLVAAAAVVPAYIGAKVFELLLGGLFQKHNPK